MAKGRQLKASAAAGPGGPAPAAYDYLPPHNARPGPSSYSPNAHNNKPLPKVTYRKPPPSSSSSSSASAPFSKPLPPPDPSPSRPRPPRPDSALSTSTAYSARAAVVHTASRAVPVKKGKVYSVKRSSNRDSGLSSRDSLASLTDDGGASEYDPDEQAREMPMRRALPAKLDIAKASRVNHQDSMASPQPLLNYPSPTEGVGRPTKSNSTLSINVAAMSSSSSSQSNAARRRSKGGAATKQPPMPQRTEPSDAVGAQWASLASEPDSFDADGNLDKLAAWSSSTDLHASARKMKWKEAVEMAQARQPNGISHAHTPSEPRGTAYLLNSLLSSHASIEMTSSFTQPAFASVEEYELAKRELRRLQDRLADKKSRLRTLKRIRGAVGKLAKASTPAGGPSRSTSINGLQTPLGAHADLPASASDVSVTSIANSSGRPRRPTLAGQQHSRNLSNITSFSTTTESQGLGASHEAAVEQVDRMVEEVLGLQEKIEGLKTRLREHVARVLLERCEALEADKGLPRGDVEREAEEAPAQSASTAELEEARQQHSNAQAALAQSQAALRESQQAHDQTRETLQQAQKSLAESEKNLTASKKANTELQARVGERERADRAASSRLAKLEAELASEQGRTKQLSTSLASMRSDHDALRTNHDSVNRDLESMRASQGDHSSQAASALARYEELELAVSAERKIMAERDALFHAFEARLERAEGTLRDQDRRCAALLGKAEGREELDDFLAKIRGGGTKAKEKTAGQDIDQLLSSLGQHVEDLADEMARRRRGDDSFSYNGDGSRDDFSRADDLEDQLEQSRNEATRLRAQVEDGRLQIEALNSSLNRPDSTSRVVSARLSSKPAHWRSPSTASSSAAAAHQVQELQDRVSTMARENEELRERLASRSAGSDSSLVKVGGSDDGRGDFDASLPLVTSLEKLLPDGLSAGMDLNAFLAALNSVPPSVSAESSVLLTRLRTVINLARTSTERALARNTDTPSSDAPTSTALSRSSTVASAQTKAGLRSIGLKPIQISKSGFLPYRSIGDGLPGTAPATPAKDNESASMPKSAGSLMPPRGLVPRRSFSAMDASTSPNSASSPLPSPSYPRTAGAEPAGGSTTFLTSPSEASSTAQLMSRLRNLESQLHTLKSGKRAAVERCEALEAKLVEMEAELEEGRKREVRWLEGMNDASANAAGSVGNKGLGGGNGPPSTAAAVSTPTKAGQGQGQDQLSVSRPGDSPTRSPSPRLFNIALPVLTGWGGSGAQS